MSNSQYDSAVIEEVTRRVVARLRDAQSQIPSPAAKPFTPRPGGKMLVPVNLSVRHCHLCREHMEILYGPGFELEKRNPLYQPGEFASKQTVTLVGPRQRCLGDVRVLGPLRKKTQVEVSRTDAIFLGIDPPVNPSGNHEGSSGLILVGPVGVVHLKSGVILANRHIHLSKKSADQWGLTDNQTVKVRVETSKKTLLEDCQLRVSDLFLDEMHLDTDDGNACGLRGGEMVEIIP